MKTQFPFRNLLLYLTISEVILRRNTAIKLRFKFFILLQLMSEKKYPPPHSTKTSIVIPVISNVSPNNPTNITYIRDLLERSATFWCLSFLVDPNQLDKDVTSDKIPSPPVIPMHHSKTFQNSLQVFFNKLKWNTWLHAEYYFLHHTLSFTTSDICLV